MERIKIKFKNLIKISKIRERMGLPILLVMRIVILFDWTMEFFLCFIRPKNSHSKINWKANHSQFSLALEGWGGHWLEGRISKLPLGKGNKLMERSWRLTKGEGSLLGWEKEKRKEGMCGKKKIKISSYVWKVVVHERDVCTN